MLVKTMDLHGAALDWAVAQCEGQQDLWQRGDIQFPRLLCEIMATQDNLNLESLSESMDLSPEDIEEIFDRANEKWESSKRSPFSPSTDWSQGGPIIEREEIALDKFADYPNWQAECNTGDYHNRQLGPTALVAAMRCFVASRLGFEIEVPDEIATAKPVANQGLSV